MISVEKPGSPAEILEHHGVKGQKWGVRKKFNTANPTSRDKATAIYRARTSSAHKHMVYATEKGTARTNAQRKAAKLTYLKDPDRATALRMTRGEKVVMAIIAGVTLPTVAIPVGIGIGAAGRVAYRRHVEKKQARGGYK